MPATRRSFLRSAFMSFAAVTGLAWSRLALADHAFKQSGLPASALSAGELFEIDFFVRHDGTATAAQDASNPDSAATSLNLQSLFDESLAGNIPPGSVVGFSDQGGTFGSFPDRDTFYIAQVYLANGVTYTNVPGEHPFFYPIGQRGGTENRGPHNFLASRTPSPAPTNPHIDNPATAVIRVNSTGSISIQNDSKASNVEIHGTSGSGGDGYGGDGSDTNCDGKVPGPWPCIRVRRIPTCPNHFRPTSSQANCFLWSLL